MKRRKKEHFQSESRYLDLKLTLNALFLSFGVHGDGPFGLVAIFRRLFEGGPGFEIVTRLVGVCREGVFHG